MRTVAEILGGRKTHSVLENWSVRRVVEFLCEKRVGAVPVVDGDQVVGVFSERDLMHRVVQEGLDLDNTLVAEVMTRDVISVSSGEPFLKAKALMLQHNVRHLVVQDQHGRLKGFVSLRQLSEEALSEANFLITRLNDSYYQASLRD